MREFIDNCVNKFVLNDGYASYACRPENTRGRIYKEHPSKTRNDFERDRDRIIYSEGFRKLRSKTQVFFYDDGDHYRTRLSHSMEVAQVARHIARLLRVNEDLAEASALAHDMGHTPFAHEGERALKECMKDFGGFDHNDQTLRVITYIENKYPDFRGLNLTWEMLESLIKHNGPVLKEYPERVALNILKKQADFMLDKQGSIEAQCAAIADDIAYNSHDIEDGLHSKMFTIEELAQVGWVGEIIKEKREEYPQLQGKIFGQEIIRDIMGGFVADVMKETITRLSKATPKTEDDVRNTEYTIVSMSDDMITKNRELKTFLYNHFYDTPYVRAQNAKGNKVVTELFDAYINDTVLMAYKWQDELKFEPEGFNEKTWRYRVVADCIASMTDKRAILEHEKIYTNN